MHQEELKRFIPHVVVVTGVVAVLPLLVSFSTGEGLIVSVLTSFLLSTALGGLGAAMWQRMEGSRDVVFNDLLVWGFVRRVRARRRSAVLAEQLGNSLSRDRMSSEQQLKKLSELAVALESGDPYTNGHSQRVARHARMIAKGMGLSSREVKRIQLAALLHDVGKLRIPRSILITPKRLTDAQFDIVKMHPVEGERLVTGLGDPEISAIVRHHHERIDGTGYPDRIAGGSIPVGARIIAVADTFDAITSRRAYRGSSRHRVAIEIIEKEAGKQLDALVVKAFISYYSARRSVWRWSLVTSTLRHLPENILTQAGRATVSGVANAVVVGTSAIALAGGAALEARLVDPSTIKNAQTEAISASGSASAPDDRTGSPSERKAGEKGKKPEEGAKGNGKVNKDKKSSTNKAENGGPKGPAPGKDKDAGSASGMEAPPGSKAEEKEPQPSSKGNPAKEREDSPVTGEVVPEPETIEVPKTGTMTDESDAPKAKGKASP